MDKIIAEIRARLDRENPETFEIIEDKRRDIIGKEREELLTTWANNEIRFALENLRSQRNGLLAASDWTQAADAPVDAKAWAAYRQELRDLPETITDPTAEIKWPEPPK